MEEMTVTIPAKHEQLLPNAGGDSSDNESCCCTKTYDDSEKIPHHSESLLDDLNIKCEHVMTEKSEIMKDYDNITYEKSKTLLNFDEAPGYMQHNIFIRTGYRNKLDSNLCLESIFWWTNETVNIWSHIFGLVLFISLTVNDLLLLKIDAPLSDKIIIGAILICFQVCMGLSALYHTFSCRSEKDCDYFLSLDLFGIALSLYGIYVSGIYYAYWCNHIFQNFYLVTVTAIFILAMILQIPQLNVHSNIKMITFVLWAAYGVVPTFHWFISMGGYENPVVALLVPRVFGMYAISGMAFLIYITKIPERFASGKFDFIGHSHQWWHFFVVMALYYWHNTGMIYIEYRLNHACANSMRIV